MDKKQKIPTHFLFTKKDGFFILLSFLSGRDFKKVLQAFSLTKLGLMQRTLLKELLFHKQDFQQSKSRVENIKMGYEDIRLQLTNFCQDPIRAVGYARSNLYELVKTFPKANHSCSEPSYTAFQKQIKLRLTGMNFVTDMVCEEVCELTKQGVRRNHVLQMKEGFVKFVIASRWGLHLRDEKEIIDEMYQQLKRIGARV